MNNLFKYVFCYYDKYGNKYYRTVLGQDDEYARKAVIKYLPTVFYNLYLYDKEAV